MRRTMILVMAVLLTGAALAEAQMCGGMGRGMGMRGSGMGTGMCGMMSGGEMGYGYGMAACGPCAMAACFEELDLTDAQWEDVDAIMGTYEEAITEAYDQAGGAGSFDGFIRLFSSSDLSISDLNAFAERAASLEDELATLENETIVQLHDVLSRTQLEELSALGSSDNDRDYDSRWGCGMGRMGGMGGTGCGGGRTGGGMGRGGCMR